MVAVKIEQSDADDILAAAICAVQEAIDAGNDLRPAAEIALRRLIAEGRGPDLLDVIGATALMSLWRDGVRHERREAYREASEPVAVAAVALPVRAKPAAAVVGVGDAAEAKRVEREALAADAAMYGLRVNVDGTWMRLGDMTQGDCRAVFLFHASHANGHAREARWFKRLEAGLKGARTVKEQYSFEELTRIRREVEGE